MAGREIRLVDDGNGGTRFGYQPKAAKKIDEGHKPKDNPAPLNPPHGKKGDAGTSNAKK
jgi:hypothetical protein